MRLRPTSGSLPPRKFRPSTKPVFPDFMSNYGQEFGCRKERQRTSSASLTPRSEMPWPIRQCGSGWKNPVWTSRRARSKRRKRSARISQPKGKNGGQGARRGRSGRNSALSGKTRFELGIERIVSRENIIEISHRDSFCAAFAQKTRQRVNLIWRAMQDEHAG